MLSIVIFDQVDIVHGLGCWNWFWDCPSSSLIICPWSVDWSCLIKWTKKLGNVKEMVERAKNIWKGAKNSVFGPKIPAF